MTDEQDQVLYSLLILLIVSGAVFLYQVMESTGYIGENTLSSTSHFIEHSKFSI